jgi:MFS transporter, ACS family, tartrate transporter
MPDSLERATLDRVSLRLLPFLFMLYIVSFLDRSNLAIAALQMNRDLKFGSSVYGLGAGVFFIGYALFEVPSNLILARVGARRWIARIMLVWGVIASAMLFVRTPAQFYTLRFLLGVAEAGFFPGIIYYLSLWFPSTERARALSRFMVGIPMSLAIGGPLGGWLLGFDGRLGLHGWQWLFLLEGAPAVLLGIVVWFYLTDSPDEARWLTDDQRAWLTERLRRDRAHAVATEIHDPLRALRSPLVWLVALPPLLSYTIGYAHVFWTPTIIRDTLHVGNSATGWIIGAMALVWSAMSLWAADRSDRVGERFLYAAASLALCSVGFAAAALLPPRWGLLSAFMVIGIGQMTFLPVFWCVPLMVLRSRGAAAGIGLVNAVASVGGFVGPYALGLFREATGSAIGAYLTLAVVAACASSLILVLRGQPEFASAERAAVA